MHNKGVKLDLLLMFKPELECGLLDLETTLDCFVESDLCKESWMWIVTFAL